jgi:cation diffusion facilitator family transporter
MSHKHTAQAPATSDHGHPAHAAQHAHGAHDHDHPHEHDHSHDHGHSHDHSPHKGVWGWIDAVFHLHGHSGQQQALAGDRALMSNETGIRTVWLALAALTITALLQIVIVWISGSVALLADTIHNIGDGLNSIPLLIAFYLARRAATRRYTYGFARAEDIAGVFIVLSIAVSAGVIFYQSIYKLIYPAPLTNLGWVAIAAIVGFLGNEAVALLQIRKGREIGSAALVADGQHARTDGLTSLAVLLAAGGAWLGYPIVDPIIGILIGIAILFITKDASVTMWYRLMDAIEPEYMERAEEIIRAYAEVKELCRLRMRWVGHQIFAEVKVAAQDTLSMAESHHLAEHLRHDLRQNVPFLADVEVYIAPLDARHEHPGEGHDHAPSLSHS